MNIDLLGDYLPLYAAAAWVTLWVGLTGVALAIAVGLICATIQRFKIPIARQIVSVYIEVSRNTPLVVQLFFLYFGLPKVGIVLSAATCAVIGLAFQGGSYMAESFRSGLEAVSPDQTTSAMSLGMTPPLVLRHVVLPQAIPLAMPSFTANVIFLIKETSVVSIVALPDLMYLAKDLLGSDYNTTETLTMLVGFYLVILLPVSLGAAALEKRVRRAAFGD